jgi:PAS domain S-box-containing protein
MLKTIFITVFVTLFSGVASAAPTVLVIHSYHRGNEWTASIGKGMETVLQDALPEAELFIEYMDSKRHPREFIFPVFQRFLNEKYASRRFDIILCSDDNALDFLLALRDKLFPDVPVVFCGINNFSKSRLGNKTGFTGVTEVVDLRGTLDLALRLHPGTENVGVVSDTTPSGQVNLQLVRKILPLYADRVKFLDLSGLGVDQLKKALRALPPHTVILDLCYFQDGRGRYFTVRQANRMICRTSGLPVYSPWDFGIKEGVIGGRIAGGIKQGKIAANLALRILHGERPEDIPVVRDNLHEYLVDYQAMSKFKIPLSSLPEGTRILNRPHTFYALSRHQLLAALVIMSFISLALLIDIILRYRAEKALKNRQARLKALHDNVAAGIALADPSGRYLEVNEKWAEMFHCAPLDIIGKTSLDLTFPEDRDLTLQESQNLLEGKKDSYRLQKRFMREDGSIFWVDNSVTRIMDEEGRISALAGIIVDITEHKQTEEKLQAANRELDAFVRTASHDLRSPLTIIIGFSEYLLKEYRHRLDEQGIALVKRIEQCGHKMRQLLEDLLAFARVGYIEIPQEAVDSNLIVLEVILAQTQNTEGIVIERGPLPCVHIPKTFLLQVFDNLIGNAVKYAGKSGGPIQVGGEVGDDRIRFFVRDHGPGINPEEKKRIFDPFFRGAAGRDISGTGIGLATVRKIARLYHGNAWLEDTPGGGCTFWVEMRDIRGEPNGEPTDRPSCAAKASVWKEKSPVEGEPERVDS